MNESALGNVESVCTLSLLYDYHSSDVTCVDPSGLVCPGGGLEARGRVAKKNCSSHGNHFSATHLVHFCGIKKIKPVTLYLCHMSGYS